MKSKHGPRHTILKGYFGNIPVIDAKENLLVIPNGTDVKRAKRGDPSNCALSQACKRAYNSKAVLFLRSQAYIDLPSSHGNRRIYRFTLGRETREAIAEFDKTGTFPEKGFRLAAPSAGKRMKALRAYFRKYAKAVKNGTRKPKKRAGSRKSRVMLSLQGVRDGSGVVGQAKAA